MLYFRLMFSRVGTRGKKWLRWRHNDHDGVSNHQPHGCLLNCLFRRRSKKPSKLRVTGLYAGSSPGPVNSPHKGPVTRKMTSSCPKSEQQARAKGDFNFEWSKGKHKILLNWCAEKNRRCLQRWIYREWMKTLAEYREYWRQHHNENYHNTMVTLNRTILWRKIHCNDIIMSAMASQITSLAIVYSTAFSAADERKHQSSTSLAFVRGLHRWSANSPHKGPVTRKMFPFDDIIMNDDIKTVKPQISARLMATAPQPLCVNGNGNIVVIQWQSSVSGTKTPVYTGIPLLKEILVAGVSTVSPVVFQWSSSVFYYFPIMQINTRLPLGHQWMLASASVVPVVSQCTCGSRGFPVCFNYANYHWIVTGRSLGDSISKCGCSEVCLVVSQCTDSIWFGGQQVRSLSSMQPLMCKTGMARVVWAKRISFELQPQIHKNYNGAQIKSIHWVMLKYSHVWRAELVCIAA